MSFCFVTACTVYAYYLLQHAQCMLTICYRMRSVNLQFVTAYAHVQCNLTICYRMRSVRLQLVPACAVLCALTKHKISGVFLLLYHTRRIC
jgi:hypothetical protein